MSDPPAINWNSRFLGVSRGKPAEGDQTAYPKEDNSLQLAGNPQALLGSAARGGTIRAEKRHRAFSAVFAWL
jgi:hypothetical protein